MKRVVYVGLLLVLAHPSRGALPPAFFAHGRPSYESMRKADPMELAAAFRTYLKDPKARRIYCGHMGLDFFKDVNYSAGSNGLLTRALLLGDRDAFGIVNEDHPERRIRAVAVVMTAVAAIPPQDTESSTAGETPYLTPFFALGNSASQLGSALEQAEKAKTKRASVVWRKTKPYVASVRREIHAFISTVGVKGLGKQSRSILAKRKAAYGQSMAKIRRSLLDLQHALPESSRRK